MAHVQLLPRERVLQVAELLLQVSQKVPTLANMFSSAPPAARAALCSKVARVASEEEWEQMCSERFGDNSLVDTLQQPAAE